MGPIEISRSAAFDSNDFIWRASWISYGDPLRRRHSVFASSLPEVIRRVAVEEERYAQMGPADREKVITDQKVATEELRAALLRISAEKNGDG